MRAGFRIGFSADLADKEFFFFFLIFTTTRTTTGQEATIREQRPVNHNGNAGASPDKAPENRNGGKGATTAGDREYPE